MIKNHKTINYDDKNYICKKHNDSFNTYCKICNENICITCEKEHSDHYIIDFRKIFINKEELVKSLEDLKNKIDEFKYKINIIKEILDNMTNMMDDYYKLNSQIINNYDIKKEIIIIYKICLI